MTKISNQYSLTNILTADLANSRLGINNVSPAYKLDLLGGNEVGSRFIVNGTYAPIQFSGDNSTTLGGINAYSDKIVFGRATSTGVNTDIVINKTTGFVGIAATTAKAQFQVSQTETGTPTIPALGTINNYACVYLTNVGGLYGLIGGAMNYGSFYLQVQRTDGSATAYNLMLQPNAGAVLVGTTTYGVLASANGITFDSGGMIYANSNNPHIFNRSTNSSGTIMQFRYNEATVVGTIAITSSTTSYNMTSDYRLKEDLKPINGLNIVNKINIYNYKWKSENNRMDGVLAHELQEVVPYAVTGIKDGEDMQGVDYSKLVPILIKSIQELSAEIDTLKNK